MHVTSSQHVDVPANGELIAFLTCDDDENCRTLVNKAFTLWNRSADRDSIFVNIFFEDFVSCKLQFFRGQFENESSIFDLRMPIVIAALDWERARTQIPRTQQLDLVAFYLSSITGAAVVMNTILAWVQKFDKRL